MERDGEESARVKKSIVLYRSKKGEEGKQLLMGTVYYRLEAPTTTKKEGDGMRGRGHGRSPQTLQNIPSTLCCSIFLKNGTPHLVSDPPIPSRGPMEIDSFLSRCMYIAAGSGSLNATSVAENKNENKEYTDNTKKLVISP